VVITISWLILFQNVYLKLKVVNLRSLSPLFGICVTDWVYHIISYHTSCHISHIIYRIILYNIYHIISYITSYHTCHHINRISHHVSYHVIFHINDVSCIIPYHIYHIVFYPIISYITSVIYDTMYHVISCVTYHTQLRRYVVWPTESVFKQTTNKVSISSKHVS
jgi:hypothetical protein